MALIKSYELSTGILASEAYHVITKLDTFKRPTDDIDPHGARPENAPDHVWKAGYYCKIAVSIYYSKAARESGKTPIAVKCKYPTDAPASFQGELEAMSELVFSVDINGELNEIAQAYEHLKTLPLWQDAIED
jgi:hypothetical protein